MSILKVQDFPTDPTTAVFTGAEPVNSVFAGPASGAASAPAFRPLVPDDIPSGVKLINANYTVTGADNGLLLVSNVSGSITVTLPNPPPLSSFDISIENPTPGALSISPNGLLLDGSASSLSVSKNQGLYIATDGVNYYSERGMGTGGGGGGTPGGTTGQLQYNSSGAFAGAAGSSVAASGAIGLGAAPAAGYDLDVTSSAANGGTAHFAKSIKIDNATAGSLWTVATDSNKRLTFASGDANDPQVFLAKSGDVCTLYAGTNNVGQPAIIIANPAASANAYWRFLVGTTSMSIDNWG